MRCALRLPLRAHAVAWQVRRRQHADRPITGFSSYSIINITPAVPEPGSRALLLAGTVFVGGRVWHRS